MKEVKRPQKPLFTFYIIIIAVVMVFNILLLPAMAISLRTKLRRIDEQEARKTRPEEEEEPYEDSDH